jgi:hypothetical protein
LEFWNVISQALRERIEDLEDELMKSRETSALVNILNEERMVTFYFDAYSCCFIYVP